VKLKMRPEVDWLDTFRPTRELSSAHRFVLIAVDKGNNTPDTISTAVNYPEHMVREAVLDLVRSGHVTSCPETGHLVARKSFAA
jgi:hypothetical protein